MIELSHEVRDGVLVLMPKTRIDANTAKSFEEQSTALADKGPGSVVIDFVDVDYISSAGLRALLSIAQRIKSAGGKLTFCGARDNVKDVFQVSGFDSLFGVHPAFKDARAALGA
jgi:anti-anti-sigma factor